jgi:hypothetical protein
MGQLVPLRSGEDLEALINEEFDIGRGKAKTLADVVRLYKLNVVYP